MQIIHIEDSSGDRLVVSEFLKQSESPTELHQFSNLSEGLAFLEQSQELERLVLLDLGLPGFFGIETLEKLFSEQPNEQVIVLTGNDRNGLGSQAISLGALDFLSKNELTLRSLERSINFSTERFRLLSSLKESNESKNRLLSLISHDLRSPINAIIMIAQMLEEDFDDYEKAEVLQHIDLIEQSAEKANALLANLLDWSRLQLGTNHFNPVAVTVEDILMQLIEFFTPQIKDKKIVIDLDPCSRHRVFADAAMLNSILRNLLSNAIKFSHPQGVISIGCEEDFNHLEIYIRDQGIGIPEKMQKALFDGSATVGRTGTSGEVSNGLGLLLAQSFAQKNQGIIKVESVVNEGSTFSLSLPIAKFEEDGKRKRDLAS